MIKYINFLIFLAFCVCTEDISYAEKSEDFSIYIEDDKAQIEAVKATKSRDFEKAYTLSKKSKYQKFTSKLITLVSILSGENSMSMQQIDKFTEKNPWILEVFQKDIEDNFNINSHQDLRAWFSNHEPKTLKAKFLMYNSKMLGNAAEIKDSFKTLWVENIFSASLEKHFQKEYSSLLTQKDIIQKLDLLIWNGKYEIASGLLKYLDKNSQSLYKLKLSALSNPSDIPKLLKTSIKSIKDTEFFYYIYIRYLLRNNYDSEGLELLLKMKPTSHFDKWWNLKRIAAKNAIREKHYKIALSLCQNHNLTLKQDIADANWYAGFISLSLLKQPQNATKYLQKFFDNVNTANSKSQGAYWLSSAYEASGDKKNAEYWLNVAAEYPGNFYGQLALVKLHPKAKINLFKDTVATNYHIEMRTRSPAEIQEMAIAAKVLFLAGYQRYAFDIMRAVAESKLDRNCTDYISLHYIRSASYPLVITFAKYLVSNGHPLSKPSYPKHMKFDMYKNLHSNSLYYAIIRQESDFNQNAVSTAGAIGLMQLMPATAKKYAKDLGMKENSHIHSANANVAQGCMYLDQIMEKFDSSYVLTAAAYNAGPHKVTKWLENYGDIRGNKSLTKTLNWIEMIPYNETKLYVKKIIENMVIYDAILYQQSNVSAALYFYLGLL